MREIARPNNDTLYIGCMLDLRKEPVILEMPAFDSKYVSLMVTGYDHYVNVPMTTRLGDFRKPEKMLFYASRTERYKGEPVEGVARLFEASGDFNSAVFRVMPHSHDPERFTRIVKQMQSVKLVTPSEYQGGKTKPWTSEAFKNKPEEFRFAVIGERTGGSNAEGVFQRARDQLNLLQPEFVINVGDLVEGDTQDKTTAAAQ